MILIDYFGTIHKKIHLHLECVIILTTIIITRFFLYIYWGTKTIELQKIDNWHHIYTGFLLILISLIFKHRSKLLIWSVGLGLIFDEFIHIFHLMQVIEPQSYWSAQSIGMTILSFGIYTIMVNHSFGKARYLGEKPPRQTRINGWK